MITIETVKEYIDKMYGNDLFLEAEVSEQDKIIFNAHELLRDHFKEVSITNRSIAIQTLYTLEGEDEEYAKLKRHGVKSYSVKGVSVTFEGTGVSPDVIGLLIPKLKTRLIGRLI